MIDPDVKKHDSNGMQIIDYYRKAGLVCQTGNNDVRASISRIRQLLQKDENHKFPAQHPRAGELGSPRIFFTRDCHELIWEMGQWQWKQVRPGGVDRETPLAKHDHAIAALRYLVMRNPRAAVEKPSVSQFERFMAISREMKGEPEGGGDLIDPRTFIGNERLG